MLKSIVSAAAVFLFASPCFAETFYVANYGSNNACTRTAPCANISTALSAAEPGDTIVCLSAQGDLGFTIIKSITIDCAGSGAVVRSVGTPGFTTSGILINITASADDPLRTVRLRGITVDGAINGNRSASGRAVTRGIDIQAASVVVVEDSVISNTSQYGIYDRRTGGQTRLYVKNTSVSNVGGPGIVAAAQGTAASVLDNVSLLNNTYGLAAATGNNVVITRSTISGNTTAGVHADQGAQINVLNSVLSHNTANVNAYGAVRLKENDIQFSNVAVQGGAAVSVGGNRFLGNAAPGATPASLTGAPTDVVN